MTLTIADLEEVARLYIQATSDESRLEYSKILEDWTSSDEFNSTALAIIQGQSKYDSLILYTSYALIHIIDHNTYNEFSQEQYSHDDYVDIYNACIERIKTSSNIPQKDPILRSMITLCAYSTYFSYDSALFDQFQEFSPNILIYYYDDLLVKDNDPKKFEAGSDPLFNNFDIFFDALSKAEVCGQTFVLMRSLIKKCGITFITNYIPFFQIGLEKGESASAILDLFEEMKAIDSLNLEKDEIPLIKDIVIIFIDFADKVDDPKLSSAIWDSIIDMTFDFFCLEDVGNEYTTFVFNNFQKSLQYFIENDIEEFYDLYQKYALTISYVPHDFEEVMKPYVEQMMIPFIEDFYNFVIMIVNIDLQFCNDDISEALIMISEVHSKQTLDLERSDDDDFNDDNDENEDLQNNENEGAANENMIVQNEANENPVDEGLMINNEEEETDEFYINVLTQYYTKNLNNLSQGYIYAFSFAPLETIKLLSSNIAMQIKSSSDPPPTTVYFVTNCCQYIGDSIDSLIQICFKCFDMIKVKDIGNALVSFSKYYPDLFLSKFDTYLPLIFDVIKSNDMLSVMPYFIALFTVFPQIKDESKETHELFSIVGGLFLNHILDPTNNLEDFCNDTLFVQGIIKDVKPKDNELMKSFLNSLFDQILEVFSPLLASQDSIVQEKLSQIISEALHNDWVGDREKILEWINAVILECPNENHFLVLNELMDLLPSKEFKDFISKTDEMTDEMIRSEIIFFTKAFKYNVNLVLELPIDLILFYLTKDPALKFAFRFLRRFLNCKDVALSEDDIKKILDALLHCFFEYCRGDDSADCIKLIRSIAVKYMGLEALLNEILQIIGPYNESDVAKFCHAFMSLSDMELGFVSGSVIQIYKKNHPTE